MHRVSRAIIDLLNLQLGICMVSYTYNLEGFPTVNRYNCSNSFSYVIFIIKICFGSK